MKIREVDESNSEIMVWGEKGVLTIISYLLEDMSGFVYEFWVVCNLLETAVISGRRALEALEFLYNWLLWALRFVLV